MKTENTHHPMTPTRQPFMLILQVKDYQCSDNYSYHYSYKKFHLTFLHSMRISHLLSTASMSRFPPPVGRLRAATDYPRLSEFGLRPLISDNQLSTDHADRSILQ